jgi:hypothetical protein
LVVLSVVGLFALLLTGLMGSAAAALRSDAFANRQDGALAIQRVLRARLERLKPVVRSDSSVAVVDFRGDSKSISFLSSPLDRVAPAELQQFRLQLSPGGDLVLYFASSLEDSIDLTDPALAGWQSEVLEHDVENLDIAYFGPDRVLSEDRWQIVWSSRPQPPALVRIRVSFKPGDRRIWNDLVVRPHATINTACRIQKLSGRCEDA